MTTNSTWKAARTQTIDLDMSTEAEKEAPPKVSKPKQPNENNLNNPKFSKLNPQTSTARWFPLPEAHWSCQEALRLQPPIRQRSSGRATKRIQTHRRGGGPMVSRVGCFNMFLCILFAFCLDFGLQMFLKTIVMQWHVCWAVLRSLPWVCCILWRLCFFSGFQSSYTLLWEKDLDFCLASFVIVWLVDELLCPAMMVLWSFEDFMLVWR